MYEPSFFGGDTLQRYPQSNLQLTSQDSGKTQQPPPKRPRAPNAPTPAPPKRHRAFLGHRSCLLIENSTCQPFKEPTDLLPRCLCKPWSWGIETKGSTTDSYLPFWIPNASCASSIPPFLGGFLDNSLEKH